MLPIPRFSSSFPVLDLFRGGKSAVAFWASFYAHAAIFGIVSKVMVSIIYVMCYTKSRHILCLIIYNVNYIHSILPNKGNNHSRAPVVAAADYVNTSYFLHSTTDLYALDCCLRVQGR